MDNLFGPLSPSISSRRTSASSTESCIIPKNKARPRSEIADAADTVLTAREICFLAEPSPLPPVPGSHGTVTITVAHSSGASEDSNSLCCVPTSTLETATIICDKQAVSFVFFYVTNFISNWEDITLVTKCTTFYKLTK